MKEKENIQPMQSDFEQIKQVDENQQEFWSARALCSAMGYSSYQKFERLLTKCIDVARQKALDVDDHFNHVVEMVQLGSGAYRKVENLHLSRLACLIIAENADGKKEQVQLARVYFKQQYSTNELLSNVMESNILLYKTAHGESRVEVIFNNETFWMSQKRMSALFGVDVSTINYHLSQIYESGELQSEATIRKIEIVQTEGDRDVNRQPLFYNLDAIIAVGYRVNSYQATQFRIWTTKVLKDFIIKGFVLDDERMKQGTHFGKDYFDDLLQRIREIRTSERRYYQKITDIYAECSIDYDAKSAVTKQFYAHVQNMMHFAVTQQTAAEIIYSRVDAGRPHMGLTTWKNAPDGRIQKSDSIVAKNYLSDSEIQQLERLSTAFLDLAELRAQRHQTTDMAAWKTYLENFLSMNDYSILQNVGSVSAEQAQQKAYSEYEKFRVIQDKEFLSDFDKEIKRIIDSNSSNKNN